MGSRVGSNGRCTHSITDLISSLVISESSNTTSTTIKSYQNTQTRPLVEYINEDPGQFTIESALAASESKVKRLIKQVDSGLRTAPPKLSSLGTGGVYFLSSSEGETLAVFKPVDEEPNGINNPKGYKEDDGSPGLREGINSGEGAMREFAAYLLDYSSISGVPVTTMASMTSKVDSTVAKVGSLQEFVAHDYDAEECGTGLFSVDEVHKICLADLRYVNTDRNGQNILVRKEGNGETRLTPIDHGYCFPASLKDLYFEWTYWPQAKQPFGPKLKKFVEELDPEADLELLRRHDIVFRSECNQVFLFVNYLLKWAVRQDCTPRDISILLSDRKGTLSKCFQLAQERSCGVMTDFIVYKVLNHHSDALKAAMN